MKKILSIYLTDLRNLWKVPTGFFLMIALAILPSVYAWILKQFPIGLVFSYKGGVSMNKLSIWIVLLLFLFPANTYALSCAQMPSMDQAYDQYDGVIIGLVDGVVRKKDRNQMQLTVVKSFKGIEEHAIKVDEDITWGSLNGPSEKGVHYLFFLKKNGSEWVNPLCSPSKKLADASKELDYLKDKEIPLKEAKAATESFIGDNASKLWSVIAIFVGLIGAILVRILRYRKRSNRNK